MHVYKIKTQSKVNCTEQHYEFQSIESTDSTADCCHCGEKRWDHPLFAGFFILVVDISVQWSRAEEERHWKQGAPDTSVTRPEVQKNQPTSTPRPTPPMHPARPLSVCPRELCVQARLQSLDVLADGYEAEVSVMMERIRKTRKHSGF